jgi:hypothetical protein
MFKLAAASGLIFSLMSASHAGVVLNWVTTEPSSSLSNANGFIVFEDQPANYNYLPFRPCTPGSNALGSCPDYNSPIKFIYFQVTARPTLFFGEASAYVSYRRETFFGADGLGLRFTLPGQLYLNTGFDSVNIDDTGVSFNTDGQIGNCSMTGACRGLKGYWSSSEVPVPATIAVLSLGLVGISAVRRKQA